MADKIKILGIGDRFMIGDVSWALADSSNERLEMDENLIARDVTEAMDMMISGDYSGVFMTSLVMNLGNEHKNIIQ